MDTLEQQELAIRTHVEKTQRRADAVIHAFESQPILQEALDDWFLAIDTAWRASSPGDVEGRERLYHAFRAGIRFRDYLRGVLDAGKATAMTAAEVLGPNGSIGRNSDRSEP
jgi:hypothetical protein